jgi:segregation and condensation protein A
MSAENPSEAVSESEPPVGEPDTAIAAENGGDASVEPAGASEPRRVSEAVPAASAEGADAAAADGYRVNLPMFEGPLDLLLHLVQKHELDILDIPIAFITEKYTAYIRMLDELNIDLASEYLVMAATLVHIKSRMLLPNAPVDEEDEAEEAGLDPRADLVRRLLEYQKYKNAAEELAQRSITGKDVFPRGSPLEAVGGQMPLMAVSMFQLIDVFQSVLERTAQTRQHEIDFERFSISEKISELLERLRGEGRVAFERIFSDDRSRGEIIVTFLALLEMTRLRLTWLFQDGPLEPIYVELRVTDEEAAEVDVEASEASFAPPAPQSALEEGSLEDDSFEEGSFEDDSFEEGSFEADALEADSLAAAERDEGEGQRDELEAELLALEHELAEGEGELKALEPEPAEVEAEPQVIAGHAELEAELEVIEPEQPKADQGAPGATSNDTGVEQT